MVKKNIKEAILVSGSSLLPNVSTRALQLGRSGVAGLSASGNGLEVVINNRKVCSYLLPWHTISYLVYEDDE